MKVLLRSIGWLGVSVTVLGAPVLARPAHRAVSHACCHVPAGTVVQVELVNPLTTETAHKGDTFALSLASPLVENGMIILPAGTAGTGRVVDSTKPGIGGKPAVLVLAASDLGEGRKRVLLRGLRLSGAGHSNATAAQVAGLGGIAFFPLGFIGTAIPGGEVTFPAGTKAIAQVSEDVVLPAVGRAPRGLAANEISDDQSAQMLAGPIPISPPPPGQGQIVFFRAKSILGTGQDFKVREGHRSLGRLTNGNYFIESVDPGQHTYSATFEPELKDRLTLQIDPGETYFVEGALTKGLVVGAADLTPSSAASFEKVAKDLKQAAPISDEDANPPSSSEPADSSAAGAASSSQPQ